MKFDERLERISNERQREVIKEFLKGKLIKLGASTFEVFLPFYDPYRTITGNLRLRINAVKNTNFTDREITNGLSTELVFNTESIENFIADWQEVLTLMEKYNQSLKDALEKEKLSMSQKT